MIKRFIFYTFIGFSSNLLSQELGFNELADSLIKSNPEIKRLQLDADINQLRKLKTSYLGSTNSNLQYGQISTSLNDRYIELDQEINNPFSTTAQRKSNELEFHVIEVKTLRLTESLLKELKDLYDRACYYQAQTSIYMEEKALFDELIKVSENKLNLSEMSLSEFALIRVQASQLALKVQESEYAFHETEEAIRTMCGIHNYSPISFSNQLLTESEIETYKQASLSPRFAEEFDEEHKWKDQQIRTAQLTYLPNLSAGYFNQSIDQTRGFQGFKVGVRFSILDGQNKFQIQEAELNKTLIQDVKKNKLLTLENQLENTLHHFETHLEMLYLLEASTNQEMKDVSTFAEQGSFSGELDPLQYIQLRQKILEVQLLKQELQLTIRLLSNELDYLIK